MKDAGRLTLEQKVGQLFLLGFQGHTLDFESTQIVDVIHPGGFVCLPRNIESFDQLCELTNRLKEISTLPCFIAVDQEGGRVDRLKHIYAPVPATSELASAGTAFVRLGARIIATELESSGFNTDFAPVVDLRLPGSIVGERAMGPDPNSVSRLAGAFVDELAKKNIVACAKHFPGLGGAKLDPHFVLPRIDRPKRQLQQDDVLPFLNLLDDAPMIMVSHGHYPALGDEKPTPASLSARIVDGFLRKKLGFEGVIVTDDLTMGAVTSMGLTPDLFVRAFEAGNDIIVFSQTTPLVEQAFTTILRAARRSPALRQRVDQSVERILKLKSRFRYTPMRYRAQTRARLIRQIDKLQSALIEVLEHRELLKSF
jgi:beta-N-acetylhexosaminidase